MAIRVEIQGKGMVAEFPDGTSDNIIDAAIKRDYFAKAEEPGFLESAGRVAGAVLGGIPAGINAGYMGAYDLGKNLIQGKGLDESLRSATETIDVTGGVPSQLLKTQGQREAAEGIGNALMYLPRKSGEGLGMIAEELGGGPNWQAAANVLGQGATMLAGGKIVSKPLGAAARAVSQKPLAALRQGWQARGTDVPVAAPAPTAPGMAAGDFTGAFMGAEEAALARKPAAPGFNLPNIETPAYLRDLKQLPPGQGFTLPDGTPYLPEASKTIQMPYTEPAYPSRSFSPELAADAQRAGAPALPPGGVRPAELPAGQGFEMVNSPYQKPIMPGLDVSDMIIKDMVNRAQNGNNYGIEEVNAGGGWERRHMGTDNPNWLFEVLRDTKSNKNEVISVLNKFMDGSELTGKQSKIANKLNAIIEDQKKSSYYSDIQEKLGLYKDGFVDTPEGVMAGNLKLGDELVQGGEKFKVTGEDADGNLIVKDGKTFKVDPFDKIEADHFKEADPTPIPFKPGAQSPSLLSESVAKGGKIEPGGTTLYSNPIKPFMDMYSKYLGTPAWDYIWEKKIPQVLDKVPGGSHVLRALDTEYRGNLTSPKAFNDLLDATKNNQGIGRDYAIDIGNRLQSMKEAEQIQVGQFLRGEQDALPTHLEKIGTEARDALTVLGKQAVDAGLLNEQTFFSNIGKYFPRLYEAKEYTSLIQRFKEPVPNRMDMSRFQKRKDIPKEIREQMGEILTPGYPVAKGIVQLTHDVSLAKMFRGISERPEWAASKNAAEVPQGFEQMPANKKLGVLSESFVHPEIASELNAILEVRKPWESRLGKAYGAWKYGKVILSPKTHMRNMMSNSVLAHLGGLPMYEQPYYLYKAIGEMSKQGTAYQAVRSNSNIFRTGWASSELRSLYDSTMALKDMPAGSWAEGVPLLREALSKGKQAGNKMADIYQKEEQVFKMAKVLKNLDQGMDIKAAVADANKWLFDYSKVTRFQEKYRQSLLGAPFATFTFKAIPRVMEAAVKTPWRFALPAAMIYGLEEWAQSVIGDTPKQAGAKDELRDDYMKGSTFGIPNFPRVPVTDDTGREYFLDLTYILPWGDIGQSGSVAGIPGALRPVSHPLMNEAIQLSSNHDLFWKQDIVKDSDTAGLTGLDKTKVVAKKVAGHVAQAFLPTPAIDATKLYAAATGNPDYRGREKPMSTVLADVGAGLKMTPVDYNDQMRRFEAQNSPDKGMLAQKIKSGIISNTVRLQYMQSKGKSGAEYQAEIDKGMKQLQGLGEMMQKQGAIYQQAFPQ